MNVYPVVRSKRRFTLPVANLVMSVIAIGSLAFLLAPQQARAAGLAFVRVNQVGYATGATKRAYLMASSSEQGAKFSVRNARGKVVYSAPIGAKLGAWSSNYPDVYALDFGPVNWSGTYTISVSGPIASASPGFRIAEAAELYSRALVNALSFYQNERDGADFIPSALRTAPGHLNDAHAMTYLSPQFDSNDAIIGDLVPLGKKINASGAWWDAGDYVKFVETTSYTVDIMGLGVRDFPEQMGREARANFTAELKFGLDWLQQMWDDSTSTLYYQVGIGSGNDTIISDHDIWRLPQVDDTYGGNDPLYRYIRNRPVFRAGPAGSLISPNLAGRLAADFAECYQIFHTSRPAYAKQCLLSAEHIFDLANTNPQGDLLTAAPFDSYPEVEWRDDLELGATELAIALGHGDLPRGLPHTNPLFYLKSAAHWANAYITGPNDAADTLNLYDVSGIAHYELYRALSRAWNAPKLAVSRQDLLNDLKKQLDRAVAQSKADPFGFGFPWAAFDTTSHGAGLVVMVGEYDRLTRSQAYASYGVRWLANILGANAWGTSLIVGDGSTFPDCMQHQVTNLIGSLDGSRPILAGAVVEGPNTFAASGVVDGMKACPANGVDRFAPFNNSTTVYQDNVQSWSTVEPAIDLTVTSPLAFSWQMTAGREF